jgi:hypothetical protein
MNWQNQHSKNGYTTKSNLHFQCNSLQNPNDPSSLGSKISPKVHLEMQQTVKSQGNIEQKSNNGDITYLTSNYTTEP